MSTEKQLAYWESRIGKPSPLKGKTFEYRWEKNHFAWKGEDATYSCKHRWVVRRYGKAEKCEVCGVLNKRYQWANLDHKYIRDIKYWKQMCPSCHKTYDNKTFGFVFSVERDKNGRFISKKP